MSLALTLEFSGGAELLVGNVKRHDVTIQGYIFKINFFYLFSQYFLYSIFLLLLGLIKSLQFLPF